MIKLRSIRKLQTIVLVLVLIFTPLLLVPYTSAHRRPSQHSINVFFNYYNSPFFGTDYVVEGLDYAIKDGAGVVILSGTTDDTGLVSLQVKGNFDQSGLGVHIEYVWQGVALSLNNLEVGDYEIEVNNFLLRTELYWSDDLSPAEVGVVEVWFNGAYLTTSTLVSAGVDDNLLLVTDVVAGIYTIKGVFEDYVINIPVDHPQERWTEDTIISAEMI
jgi:hypothetical protein